MNRGEVWMVNCNLTTTENGPSSKAFSERQVVILSNDASNRFLNRVQVAPVSSVIEKLYPSEAYVTINGERKKVMADQLTTVTKKRLVRKLGKLTEADLRNVEKAVNLQLGYSDVFHGSRTTQISNGES